MKTGISGKTIFLAAVLACICLAEDDDKKTEIDLIDQLEMQDGVTFSEIEDNGRKRWEVQGSRAKALDLEHIRIYNVRATFVTDNGKKIIMITDYADVNRVTMEVKTDQFVTIIYEDHVLTGIGLLIDTVNKKKFSILKDVQILTARKKEEMNLRELKKNL
jgi:hypothetical protein